MRGNKLVVIVVAALGLITSCARERSNSTGWEYNNPRNGGFQKVPFYDQETGPGLILVEGGTFTMGRSEQDVTYEWNNSPRRVTVSSFYLDQFEVTNFNWLEYLYWTKRTYEEFPMIYKNALPDTNSWRSPLAFNEPYVEYYLRHPAYQNYPVVGVSWNQANDFCKWRTDRVNEYILIREGVLTWNPDQSGDPFTTDSYLADQYHPGEEKEQKLIDLDPKQGWSGKRNDLGERIVRMEDGILLPRYRLPTEAEWEFAYYGLIGSMTNEADPGVIENRRTYPWTGHWVRQDDEQFQGDIRANFVRGQGDYMGVAGALNDAADVTAPVDSYWPNDYGLYHMAGNVSEWVMDVYRPLSHEDFDEFRPFRGNVFTTKVLGNDGVIDEKSGIVIYDVYGIKEYLHEFERVRYQRISAQDHTQSMTERDSLDSTGLYNGMSMNVKSRNDIEYYNSPPEQVYLSKSKSKDSMELLLLKELNRVVDMAIDAANNQFYMEASEIIQTNIFDGLFDGIDPRFIRQDGLGNEYPLEIIPMLRQGISDYIVNTPGNLKWRQVTSEENVNRTNYKNSDYKDYQDGDFESSVFYGGNTQEAQAESDRRRGGINSGVRDESLVMYQNDHEAYNLVGGDIRPNDRTGWPTTLVSDKSRVYKGGSWRDRAYWIVGSNRRFLDEDQATCTIGFRCAMDRLGSPKGLGRYR
ncbi:MAG: SUMF1/EgtB/PvdO family nonheme iron enzyme [Crocinitomicaceae bacterium]|nr:SUMF1/EgtB/PvdO family nonheme iron enzyme [Crocinitomicaceae bacterium]